MRTLSRCLWLAAGCVLSLLLSDCARAEPQRFALVVGVKNYPASRKLPPLAFTEADANQIAAALKTGGYDVTLMTQSAAGTPETQRFAPNAAFIRRQFADLVKTPFLKKEDCLIVVLEGHGIQLPSPTDPKQQTYYFCPADALIDSLTHSGEVQPQHNLIPVQELYDTLKQSPAGVKLLVVDACRNDPNKPGAFRSANSVTRPPVPEPPGGIAALFSCSASEQAAEDAQLKHGVFSHFLIEGLKGQSDLDGDRQITINELNEYVGARTYNHVRKKYQHSQTPEFKGEIKGWAALLAVRNPGTPPAVVTPADTPLTTTPSAEAKAVMVTQPEAAKELPAGALWENNTLKMKFRWCPPGEFLMGSPLNELKRREDEKQVKVTLSRGFWLGQHEVTQAEWETITGVSIRELHGKNRDADPLKEIGPEFPVCHITWDEAVEFCRRLTERERKAGNIPADWAFTLPTEAQWEYACRAGTTTMYSFGGYSEGMKQVSNFAWWGASFANGNTFQEKHPHQVGQKKPNPWGFHDMHGNVCEWCLDQYLQEYPGGVDPLVLDGDGGQERVVRSGSILSSQVYLRSARRFHDRPDLRHVGLGLRVALVKVPE